MASHMSYSNWRGICRGYLAGISGERNRNRIISQYPNSLYDQTYTMIFCLINQGIVRDWSTMEEVLKYDHIMEKFMQKLEETPKQGQLNKPLL